MYVYIYIYMYIYKCIYIYIYIYLKGFAPCRRPLNGDWWLVSGVWMSGCLDVWLSGCLGVRVSACLDVCLSGCLDVLMSGCLEVWVYGCLHVWMSGCLHVWMSACLDVWMSLMSWCLDVWMSWFSGCLDVWISGCLDIWMSPWNSFRWHFWHPSGALKTFWRPQDSQKSPLKVPGQLCCNLECLFGGPRATFLEENCTLADYFSIPAFKMIPGSSLNRFLVFQGTPSTGKTMKFVVLLTKIKDWLKNAKPRIGKSRAFIFHDFWVGLESLGLSLGVPVASCLEVGFWEDSEEGLGGKQVSRLG